MNLYVKNNTFWFELENLARLFFPDEKITVYKEFSEVSEPFIFTELGEKITVKIKIGGFAEESFAERSRDNAENELRTVKLVYKALVKFSSVEQAWGLLTGVRPIKLFRKIVGESGEAEAERRFLNEYFVSRERFELAKLTEKNERRILSLSRPESFSLYVGVPFCPSRCSYCSFVMASVERAKKLIEPYTSLLCEEIKATAKIVNSLGLRLESVYFGGGTPTTLSARQLRCVLTAVNDSFDMSTCREFTVEAGRPDTIDEEKLFALKENKVDRISINPQTVSNEILRESALTPRL